MSEPITTQPKKQKEKTEPEKQHIIPKIYNPERDYSGCCLCYIFGKCSEEGDQYIEDCFQGCQEDPWCSRRSDNGLIPGSSIKIEGYSYQNSEQNASPSNAGQSHGALNRAQV